MSYLFSFYQQKIHVIGNTDNCAPTTDFICESSGIPNRAKI